MVFPSSLFLISDQTELTFIRLLVRMLVPHMLLQSGITSETLLTVRTLVVFPVQMFADSVVLQMRVGFKSIVAILTHIRPLAFMYPFMRLQVTLLLKLLLTIRACKRLKGIFRLGISRGMGEKGRGYTAIWWL